MSFNVLSAANALELNVYILGQHHFACFNAHVSWLDQQPYAHGFHVSSVQGYAYSDNYKHVSTMT